MSGTSLILEQIEKNFLKELDLSKLDQAPKKNKKNNNTVTKDKNKSKNTQ